MARDRRGPKNRGTRPAPQLGAEELAGVDSQSASAETVLAGVDDADLRVSRKEVETLVNIVANRVAADKQKLGVGAPLETMGRLAADSLLKQQGDNREQEGTKAKNLRDMLGEIETSLVNDLFHDEAERIKDYQTYQQIYSMITQVGEAIQVYTDNIISPDDWTKRDIECFYETAGGSAKEEQSQLQTQVQELNERYSIDEVVETAVTRSLVAGDFFTLVLNLRQETEELLTEEAANEAERKAAERSHSPFTSKDLPLLSDPDMKALLESVPAEGGRATPQESARAELAEYFEGLITVNEGTESLGARNAAMAASFSRELATRAGHTQAAPANKKRPSLAKADVRQSVIKMIEPENVVKLYYDDTLFGYYYIEYASDPDFGRRASSDQSGLVRSIETQISNKLLGGALNSSAKDRLISRVFVKTLASKLGKAKFLADNEHFVRDAYTILKKARAEGKKAIITYVAPDQMIHWTPNGTRGYGESVLSRVKFLARLYIGTMANAFMKSIRQTEMIAYYVDTGLDSDAQNSIQGFIRAIKQQEVRFTGLKDITTVLSQVGQFNDLFIPMVNGEKPVEIETINLGQPAEVDSPFLDYLRKSIMAGVGVPAAFVGYSEEVSFARTMSMENGRFLRRVLRHQKHYGRAGTKLIRALWRNEYFSLEQLEKGKGAEDEADGKGGEDSKDTKQLDANRIFARFPAPATLNLTNVSDRAQQLSTVLELATELKVDDEDDAIVKRTFRELVVREFIPSLPWDKFDKFIEEAKLVSQRKKASKVTKKPAEDGGDLPDEDLGS